MSAIVLSVIFQMRSLSSMKSAPKEIVIEEMMRGIKAQRFNEEGQLSEVMVMKAWSREQGKLTSQMDHPALKIYQNDGNLWEISSLRGEGFQSDLAVYSLDKIRLMDEVQIQRTAQGKESPWILSTNILFLYPQKSLASTEEAITIQGPGMEMHAIGMQANLKTHVVEFLKEIKTQYVVSKS